MVEQAGGVRSGHESAIKVEDNGECVCERQERTGRGVERRDGGSIYKNGRGCVSS